MDQETFKNTSTAAGDTFEAPKYGRSHSPSFSSEAGSDSPALNVHGEETPATYGSIDTAPQASHRTPGFRVGLFAHRNNWFEYVKTRHFWLVLVLGQVLSLGITGTNTMSTLLAESGLSIPAFQILPNYILLNLVYTGFTLYRYGLRKYCKILVKHGWRYIILSFLDVEGNYFIVLAYRYTTILSAQLINFWAIIVVVFVSFVFLKVRYRLAQYAGIIICVGGMGILIASDHITGANSHGGRQQVKGDLFALLGATLYGICNVFEEFLVSQRPLYEVIGQLGFWGMIISGLQTAIVERAQLQGAQWSSTAGGYLGGFTLILFTFYSLVPVLFRLASAAFFNISLLTANFWGVVIGVQVFGYSVHWMYPIAFVLIVVGLVVYFMTESVTGEAKKPWLKDDEAHGRSRDGTARLIRKRLDVQQQEHERQEGEHLEE